jgi:hypothetical protein
MQTGFPAPLDNDSEDVAWALTTGAALWRQGDRHGAIIWLKRAVVAANEAGQPRRADELNRATTHLIAALAAPPPLPKSSGTTRAATATRAESGPPPRAFGPTPSGRMGVLKPPPNSSSNHLASRAGPEPADAPLRLGEIEALGELRAAQRERLLGTALLKSLTAEEEVKVSGLVLVLEGKATVQPTVADIPAATLEAGAFVYGQPSISDAPSLRLVATESTRVAIWDRPVIEDALWDAPEAVDRLKRASDRPHALAGLVMGSLGERLDEGLRALAIGRLEARVLSPGEVLAQAGKPVPGLVVVGVGSLELEPGGGASDRLGPGDFLFPAQVLSGENAPRTARAGAKGAIVLFGARALAHELLLSCPPLLEIFAGM